MFKKIENLIINLEQIKVIFPPENITLVGAGNGQGALVQWLIKLKNPITLVEAVGKNYYSLQNLQKNRSLLNAKIENLVVAPLAGPYQFFVHSIPAESGLLSFEELATLWPNLELVYSEVRQTVQLTHLLNKENNHQWLFLDCFPAAALLQCCQSSCLSKLDVVLVRVLINESKHKNMKGAHLDDISEVLPGFIQCALVESRHPDVAYALFVRDYLGKYKETNKAFQSAVNCLNYNKKAQTEQKAEFDKILEKNEKLLENVNFLDRERCELQNEIKRISKIQKQDAKANEQSKQDLVFIREQLLDLVSYKNDIRDYFKRNEAEIIRARKILDKNFKNEISNTAKQIQSFIGLENYWITGDLPALSIERQGYPASPDFSLVAVGLMDKNDYDLVIEFGSGYSTLVISKTILKIIKNKNNKKKVGFYSFEHLEQYFNKTKSILNQAELENNVNLVLAPLDNYTSPKGETYLYYSCEQILEQLTKFNKFRNSKILVVVDGPPASTGPLARYPALSVLLKFFPNSNIDFLLDDYIREDEKKIVELWVSELEEANIKFTISEIELERNACLLQVERMTEI